MWNDEVQEAFDKIKELITKELILVTFDQDLQPYIETDVSDFAVGAVLYHVIDKGKYSIAFISKKLSDIQV